MKWYKKAQAIDYVTDEMMTTQQGTAPLKPTFKGALPLDSSSYYGGWVSPTGEIYLGEDSFCHVRIGRKLLYDLTGEEESYSKRVSEIYQELFEKNFIRIVTKNLPKHIEVHCMNPEGQTNNILGLISKLPSATRIILDGINFDPSKKQPPSKECPVSVFKVENMPSRIDEQLDSLYTHLNRPPWNAYDEGTILTKANNIKWCRKAQVTETTETKIDLTLKGSLPLDSFAYYGGWVSPDGEIYLGKGTYCHSLIGREIINKKYPDENTSGIYSSLFSKGYVRIVTEDLTGNFPILQVECDSNSQYQQILDLIRDLPPETRLIIDGGNWRKGSVAEFRAKYMPAPKASDLLGRGGQGDVWKEEGNFSVWAKKTTEHNKTAAAEPLTKTIEPNYSGPYLSIGKCYGAWISPEMDVFLLGPYRHKAVAKQIIEDKYPGEFEPITINTEMNEIYDFLIKKGWIKIAAPHESDINIMCNDVSSQKDFLLKFLSETPDDTFLILEDLTGTVYPNSTISKFKGLGEKWAKSKLSLPTKNRSNKC